MPRPAAVEEESRDYVEIVSTTSFSVGIKITLLRETVNAVLLSTQVTYTRFRASSRENQIIFEMQSDDWIGLGISVNTKSDSFDKKKGVPLRLQDFVHVAVGSGVRRLGGAYSEYSCWINYKILSISISFNEHMKNTKYNKMRANLIINTAQHKNINEGYKTRVRV